MEPVYPVIPGVDLPQTTYAENQSEYQPLPSFKYADGTVLTRWRLSWKERVKVLFTGNLYLFMLTFNQPLQPVMLQVETPELDDDRPKEGTMKRLIITLTILGALTVSANAQTQTQTPILVTAADNGKPTDYLGGVILNFGYLYIVAYAQNVDIKVNVPDGQGGTVTTGTVVLRVNHKDYPVSYAGPAPFFDKFQQINIPIPPDEFPAGATVYLRVCDKDGKCQNSTGATVRVAQ